MPSYLPNCAKCGHSCPLYMACTVISMAVGKHLSTSFREGFVFLFITSSLFRYENGNSRSSRGCVQWVQLLKSYVHKKGAEFYSAEVVHSYLCTTLTYPVYILLTTCVQVQIYPIGYATLCTTDHLSTALCTVLLYLDHRPIFNEDRHVHRLRQLLKHRAVNLPAFLVRVWMDHVP